MRSYRKYKRYCHQCGKLYLVRHYIKDSTRYCSKKCQVDSTRYQVIVKCTICGKEKSVGHWRKIKTKEYYCSLKCKRIWCRRNYEKNCKRKIIKSNIGRPAWNKGIYIRVSPKTEFKKGQPAWNKGIYFRWSPATEFKPIPRPDLRVPIGNDRPRRSHSKIDTVMKKLKHPIWRRKNRKWVFEEQSKWEITARYIWRKFVGNIPKGCVIYHRNGDPTNNEIDNLECITRGELAERNRWKKGLKQP